MQAGTAYTERHNQVAGIVYRNICSKYGLDPPKSRWETPQKVVKNNRAKLLWDFQIQTDRKILANQPVLYTEEGGSGDRHSISK